MAEHKNDRFAVGSLYQWGRESDCHECRESNAKSGSETTYERSISDRPLHYRFIASGYYDYDLKWQVNPNKNLWKMPEKLNNPCPRGFHVPSKKEWEAELKELNSDDDAFTAL